MPTTTGDDRSNSTPEDEVANDLLRRRGLWIAVIAAGLSLLLVLGTLAAGGAIGTAGDPGSESVEASSDGDEIGRFAGAFPIPNASGVGIRETAVLDSTNDTVYVFGAASCTAGEIIEVRVNVSQQSTGAVAKGHTAAYCLGPDFVQSWIVMIERDGSSAFEPGEAFVDAWARTQDDGETTDTVSWNSTVAVNETYPTDSLDSSPTTVSATVTDAGATRTTETTAGTDTRDTATARSTDTGTTEDTGTGAVGPGFGFAEGSIAVAVLLAGVFLGARHR